MLHTKSSKSVCILYTDHISIGSRHILGAPSPHMAYGYNTGQQTQWKMVRLWHQQNLDLGSQVREGPWTADNEQRWSEEAEIKKVPSVAPEKHRVWYSG